MAHEAMPDAVHLEAARGHWRGQAGGRMFSKETTHLIDVPLKDLLDLRVRWRRSGRADGNLAPHDKGNVRRERNRQRQAPSACE